MGEQECRAQVDAEYKAAHGLVGEEAARTSLARLCGVDASIGLARHGLRMVADLDAWILDHREMDLTRLCGLSPRERCALIRALIDWWRPRFHRALDSLRQSP